MARSIKMYTHRNVTVRTTQGHTIKFEKNKPKLVPRSVEDEAMRVGAIPVEPEAVAGREDLEPETPRTQAERDDAILLAMQELVTENDADAFSASGMPKIPELSKRAGFKVDAAERDRLWEKLQAPDEA